MVRGLSCSTAYRIFLDQGSNPCPLHWQAGSQPLRLQVRPFPPFSSIYLYLFFPLNCLKASCGYSGFFFLKQFSIRFLKTRIKSHNHNAITTTKKFNVGPVLLANVQSRSYFPGFLSSSFTALPHTQIQGWPRIVYRV